MDHKRQSVRSHMEVIREAAQTKGVFTLRRTLAKHGVDEHLSSCFMQLGWTNNTRGRGSVWVGPRPSNEDELRNMANALILRGKDYRSGWNNKSKRRRPAPNVMVTPLVKAPLAKPYQLKLSGIADGPDAKPFIAAVTHPRPSRVKPKKVSLFWGLITWDR